MENEQPDIPGNIDLSQRPVVKNDDGTISTVRSISVNQDGREYLIPTVADDGSRVLSDDEATKQFQDTGRHLGAFSTVEKANAFAQQLHEQQAALYAPTPTPVAPAVAPAVTPAVAPTQAPQRPAYTWSQIAESDNFKAASPDEKLAALRTYTNEAHAYVQSLPGADPDALAKLANDGYRTLSAPLLQERNDTYGAIAATPSFLGELQNAAAAPDVATNTEHMKRAAGIAVEALRRPFSALIGPTDQQVSEGMIPWGKNADGSQHFEYKPLGNAIDKHGLIPAISEYVMTVGNPLNLLRAIALKTNGVENVTPESLEDFKQQERNAVGLTPNPKDAKWLAGLKGVTNTGLNLAEVFENPAVLSVPGNKILSGAFAADMARHIPDAINQVQQADKTPAGSQERWEAGLNLASNVVLATLAANHAVPDSGKVISSAVQDHAVSLDQAEKFESAQMPMSAQATREVADAHFQKAIASLEDVASTGVAPFEARNREIAAKLAEERAKSATEPPTGETPTSFVRSKGSAEHVPPAETSAHTELSGAAATSYSPAEIFLQKALASLHDSEPRIVERTPSGSGAATDAEAPAKLEMSSGADGKAELQSIAHESADSSRAWEDATFRGVGDVLQRKGVAPESVGWTPDAAAKLRSVVLNNFSQHGQGRQELIDRSLDVVRSDMLNNAEREGNPMVARNSAGDPVAYSAVARLRTEAGNLSAKLAREVGGEAADIARDAAVNEDGNRGQQGIPTHDEKQRLTDDLTTEIGNRFSEFVKNPPRLDVAPDATPAQILRAAKIVIDGVGEERTGQTIGLAERQGGRPSGNVQRLAADENFKTAVQSQIFDRLSAFVRDRTDASILEKKSAHVADPSQSLTAEDKASLSVARDIAKSGLSTRVVTQLLPNHLQRRIRAVAKADGGGTSEALKRIASLKTQDTLAREHKLIAKALVTNAPNFEIRADPTLSGSGTDGAFNPLEGTIRINPFLPDAQRRGTILHESVHGVLSGKVESYLLGRHHFLTPTDIKALREIDALRQEALQHTSVPEAIRQAASESKHERQMQRMRDAMRGDRGASKFYGLVSLHEFSPEVLTNKEFQTWLHSLPAPKGADTLSLRGEKNTVWTRVKQLLRRLAFTGKPVTDDSALAQAFDRSIDLIKTGRLEDQLDARFGPDFDIARFDRVHKKSMKSFARAHGFGSLEELAISEPELFNESASLFHSISRERGGDDSKREGSTMARLQPLFERADAVRAKNLRSADQRLDIPTEQIVRSDLSAGRSSLNDITEAVRSAGGLSEDQALAVGQAIHSHFATAPAAHVTGVPSEAEGGDPKPLAPDQLADVSPELTKAVEAASQQSRDASGVTQSAADQARSAIVDGFGPGAAHSKEFEVLRKQHADDLATIGATHLLEGKTSKAEWLNAMSNEYGARGASTAEFNKIWRDSHDKAGELFAPKGQALATKRQIAESTGQKESATEQTVPALRQQIAGMVSKAQAFAEYLRGLQKGANIGATAAARERAANLQMADRWLSADQERVRRQLTEFVNKTLPPDERGRFIGAIGRALTRPNLLHGDPALMYRHAFRVMRAIASRAEDVRRDDLISDIKSTLSKSRDAPGIDVQYRRGLKAFADSIATTKPTGATLQRLKSLQDYVEREHAAGRKPNVPKEELDQLSLLSKTALRDVPVNALGQLQEQIDNFVKVGRTKTKLLERAWEMEKNRAVSALSKAPADPIENRPLYRAQPAESLTVGQRFANAVRRTLDAGTEFQQAMAPMDEIYDHLDGAKGTYDGWSSKNIKGRLDLAFNQSQAELSPIRKESDRLIKQHGLTKTDLETIGVKGILRMIGKDRLKTMGVRDDILNRIDSTSLTRGQQSYYDFTRRVYDQTGERVRDIAHRLYQEDVSIIKDYVPLMRDWAMHAEREAPAPQQDPIAGEIPFDERATMRQLQHDLNPKAISRTQQGFLKDRIEGANTAVKVNAQEVFDRHISDALHFIHAQPVLKILGEIVRSPAFEKTYGKAGQTIVLDHLDTVASQGYVNHLQRVRWLDWIRNSTSKGAVGFRVASNIVHVSQLPLAAYHAGGAGWWTKGLLSALTERGQQFLAQHAAETYVRSGGEPAQADVEAFSKFGKAGFFVARNIDKLNAQATFLGRYLKEMSKGDVSPDDALSAPVSPEIQAEALRRMHRAVASPLAKDIPQMTSRGKGVGGNVSVARAINQFRNIFLDNWSNLRHDVLRVGFADSERIIDLLRNGELKAGAKEVGDATSHRIAVAFAVIAGVALETGIKMGVKQGLQSSAAAITGVTPEEKKERDDTFLAQFKHHLLNRIPFVGQATTAMLYGESGVPVIDAIVNPLKEIGTAVFKSKKPETKAKHYIKAASGVATLAGVPGSSQVFEVAAPAAAEKLGAVLPDEN
ncbi:MAG: hypothetical protein QOI07_2606 [Verrucomicrobiota bacterium]|jgi:hypothetical protein